jgi:hypothetical protein
LVAHFVGGLAADVIAFEQDLAASAGAHHAMTEIFEAGVGAWACADEEEDGGGEDQGLEDTTIEEAADKVQFCTSAREFGRPSGT